MAPGAGIMVASTMVAAVRAPVGVRVAPVPVGAMQACSKAGVW